MEKLLHYAWKHKIYRLAPLCTTDGEAVEVIDPGLSNPHAGPDFFNAKLKIGGTLWVGNVEIHTQASDWMRHGHDHDPAYDSVVLHVVGQADCIVRRSNGELLPQMLLSVPESVCQGYDELRRRDEPCPPCRAVLPSLPRLVVHSWLSALQVERLQQKADLIGQRLQRWGNHWEDVFFITLSRNFGFGLNGDAFEAWAGRLDLRAVDKHRDDLFQVEALFFGQAGLLSDDLSEADDYYLRLQREFRYLQHKFTLPAPLDPSRWRFLRLRPGNFPHVRLAQLARLYHEQQNLFSRVMQADTMEGVKQLLAVSVSPYWETHFTFRKSSARRKKQLGDNALNLILINTVIPFLYAYGLHKSDERLCERAVRFLDSLQAEDNRIIRQWSDAGLSVSTAADTQALLQLHHEYCEKRDCLRCRFGHEFLKRKGRTKSVNNYS
ncbi:MAG: DUF2851 family protein [Bacteroides sp.]|nr:DUF2851 family protein [Bacteroides sp.]